MSIITDKVKHIKVLPEGGFTGIENYVRKSCQHCRPLEITSVDGSKHTIYAPCGKCTICNYIKQQEWIVRMMAHTWIYPNVYFITLTIAPEALAHCEELRALTHAYEENGKWIPLTLSKRLHQLFLKRLRKALPDYTLSYFIAGEYGTLLSRPHWHMLLWSDKPIERDSVVSAWSFKGYDFTYNCNGIEYHNTIGDVKFDDLQANGTLHDIFDTPEPLQGFNSSYCFKYVSKYVNKYEKYAPKNIELHKSLVRDDYQDYLIDAKRTHAGETDFVPVDFDTYFAHTYWKVYRPYTQVSLRNAIGLQFYEQELSGKFNRDTQEISIAGKSVVCPRYFKGLSDKEQMPMRAFTRSNSTSPTLSALPKHFNAASVADLLHTDGYVLRGRERYLTFMRIFRTLRVQGLSNDLPEWQYNQFFCNDMPYSEYMHIFKDFANASGYFNVMYADNAVTFFKAFRLDGTDINLVTIMNTLVEKGVFDYDFMWFISANDLTTFAGDCVDLLSRLHLYNCKNRMHYVWNENLGMFDVLHYDRSFRDYFLVGIASVFDVLPYAQRVYDFKKEVASKIDKLHEKSEKYIDFLCVQSGLERHELNEEIKRVAKDVKYRMDKAQYEYMREHIHLN